MTGEKVCRCAHLDYTKVATPLRCEDIEADISEMQQQLMTQPEELVMWEHQWDWLVKPYVHKGRRSGWTTELRSVEEERAERHRLPTLCGVKVRFADD